MIRVRVKKEEVVLLSREFIPLQHQDIEGKDGKLYKVKVEGTGKEKLNVMEKFSRPKNGSGLPEEITSKYSNDEQEHILSHIGKANKTDAISTLKQLVEMMEEFEDQMQFLESECPDGTRLLNSMDTLKDRAKKLKWKK